MIYYFDTETRTFGTKYSKLEDQMVDISETVTDHLIRYILRPNSSSANHWMDEVYANISKILCKYRDNGKRPTALVISCITVGESDKVGKQLIARSDLEVIVTNRFEENQYGQPRLNLSLDDIAYALVNFVGIIDSRNKVYKFEQLIASINQWKSIIKGSPDYWRSALRFQTKNYITKE